MTLLEDLDPVERLAAIVPLLDEDRHGRAWQSLRPLQIEIDSGGSLSLEDGPVARSVLRLIFSLESIDRYLSRLSGKGAQTYLLGDAAIGRLTGWCYPSSPENGEEPKPLLEVVATCGLVYRFNVARKFGYSERGLMQSRINAWGRHLCETVDPASSAVGPADEASLAAALAPFTEQYGELLALCGTPRRPLDVARIRQLNHIVPLPVVA